MEVNSHYSQLWLILYSHSFGEPLLLFHLPPTKKKRIKLLPNQVDIYTLFTDLIRIFFCLCVSSGSIVKAENHFILSLIVPSILISIWKIIGFFVWLVFVEVFQLWRRWVNLRRLKYEKNGTLLKKVPTQKLKTRNKISQTET